MKSEANQKTCGCTALADAAAAPTRISACVCGENCACGTECACATTDQGAPACSCGK